MSLQIVHAGTKTRVEYVDPVLPVAVAVPSKREAIEALGNVQSFLVSMFPNAAVLVDGEKRDAALDFDVLRRYILTR